MELGKLGVWWSGSWRASDGEPEPASELERAGYSALWSSGGFDPGLSPVFERLLSATKHVTVASGIVSIWAESPEEIHSACADLDEFYPGRFFLGIGASHSAIVADYRNPYGHMEEYLDSLDILDTDDARHPAGRDRRILAALRPRMVALARDRSVGAHPYFVPVEHTKRTREILGPEPLLAPEVTVVLESDPDDARKLARTFTAGYLTLPNYAQNLLSLGYKEEDLLHGGSDQLVDAVVCWGDADKVADQIAAHHDAGADHVCVQVVSADRSKFPLDAYLKVASAVL